MKAAKRPEWARTNHKKARRIGDRRERTKLRAIHRDAQAEAAA
jgi:hypothetical protein